MALFPTSRLHLVVDLGTALISGMIVREERSAFAKNKKPDILEVVRVPLEGVRHTLAPALNIFFKKAEEALGGRDPATITVGLAAPYYQGKTVRTQKSFAKPTSISSEMVAALCEEKQHAEGKTLQKGEEFVGYDILAVFLNGYHGGKDPRGRVASQLDVAIRFSVWRAALKKQLYDLLDGRFPHARVKIRTFPVAYEELFYAMPHFTQQATVIDIGGGITECSFFDEGILEEVVTIPEGAEHWLARIAEEEGVSRDEVMRETSSAGNRFDRLLEAYTAQWCNLLRPIIAAKILSQPARHFFLVGGGALLPQTTAAFSSLLKTFQFGDHADVHALSVAVFRDRFGRWPSSLLSFLDISLIALAQTMHE